MQIQTALLSILSLAGMPAFAGAPTAPTQAAPATADAWEFRFGLPGWLSGLKGDAGVLGVVKPVDASFGDIAEAIDMAAVFSFEARKGRWGILTSGIYMDLSDVAAPGNPLVEDVKIELKQLMLDAALSYAVVDKDCGSLELLAGVRYNYIQAGMTITGQNETFSGSGTESWIDPYLGLLGRAKLTDTITVVGKGDIGGFDIGSELTWQLYGGLEFQLSRSCHMGVGYRFLSVDYTHGGFTYDLATSGPQIELGFDF